MAERITAENFESNVVGNSLPVLVDFYSDSCVACKKISPVLADYEEEHEGSIAVYKVNTGYDTELSEKYGVQANPTLILFVNGEEKARNVGALSPMALDKFVEGGLNS